MEEIKLFFKEIKLDGHFGKKKIRVIKYANHVNHINFVAQS